ncbi:hypothetical protein [Heyndrickxia acidicola]|uniref:LTXXQ motif family protein n=1 Tax=Heyndrickxia acidicola TaxID=209389 RepID=A0ABU6MKV1_9BACI|nr:hypothetical protein [Heyndrickxia acidicola]MED1205313.1 hypothetical protein [Heyndrickxia acidicola]
MKAKSSLIVPVLAAALAVPTIGHTMSDHKSTSTASSHQKDEKGSHEKWGKGKKHNQLINEIKQYASPQVKANLKKDLAERGKLMKELRNTPAFKKQMEQRKAEHQAFYKAHKTQIEMIKQEEKAGKITKQEAHKELKALFKKEDKKGKDDKKNGLFKELKTALQKKDRAAINSILEKFDKQLEKSNQMLQQELKADQKA